MNPRSTRSPRARAAMKEVTRGRKTRTIRFLGTSFELPTEIAGSLLWDLSEAENSTDGGLGATMRVLESMLGHDQYMAARQAVIDNNVTMDRIEGVIGRLVDDCFTVYDIKLGE